MNNKLYKVAKSLSGLVNKHNTHQQVYDQLKDIFKKNSEYFSMFKPYDLLKLTFYVKSYLDYGDFEKGESIFHNSFITGLFYLTGLNYEEDCSYCKGNGEYSCHSCGGEGEEDCPDCDGYGEDSEGDTCYSCGGGGKAECDQCGGRGELKCAQCDGYGWQETDREFFNLENVISWSDAFRLKCMDAQGSIDNYINTNQYYALKDQDKLIVLDINDDGHKDFDNRLSADNIYCVGISDEFDKHLRIDSEFNIFEFIPSDVDDVF